MKTRRGRARRERRHERQAAPPIPPAKASDYLSHLKDLVRTGAATAAILRCRVSRHNQQPQLDDQAAALRHRVEDELGIPVVGVFGEVAPGWDLDRQPELDAAIQAALAHGPGTVIVAESADRYLRHPVYNGDKKSRPTVAAFEALIDRAQGVPLATLLPPDAPYDDVRRYQEERGRKAKGTPVGRPRKTKAGDSKKHHVMMRSKLFWLGKYGPLKQEDQLSVRKLAARFNEDKTQIQRWLDEFKAGTPVITHIPPPRPKRKYKKKSPQE